VRIGDGRLADSDRADLFGFDRRIRVLPCARNRLRAAAAIQPAVPPPTMTMRSMRLEFTEGSPSVVAIRTDRLEALLNFDMAVRCYRVDAPGNDAEPDEAGEPFVALKTVFVMDRKSAALAK